jgi:membrane-associated phospholipid phosphatase
MNRAMKQWLVVSGCAVVLAVALSIAAGLAQAPLPGDGWSARALQGLSATGSLAGFVNAAGDYRWMVLVAVLLLMAVRQGPSFARGRELLPLVALGFLWPASVLLKWLIESPRPNAAQGIRVEGVFDGFGFPSGHVYGDVLVYGFIAAVIPALLPLRAARVAQAACLAVIVLAGFSRVVVGAHWPSDTIGGYLWGTAALGLVLAVYHRTGVAEAWPRSRGGLPPTGPTPVESGHTTSRPEQRHVSFRKP